MGAAVRLTARQREVARLVAAGLSNKAISQKLAVSVHTVEFHIRNAAEQIPGAGKPRYKCMVWFFTEAA